MSAVGYAGAGRSLRSLLVRGEGGDGCQVADQAGSRRERRWVPAARRSLHQTGPFSLFPYEGEQGTAQSRACAAPVPRLGNGWEQGNHWPSPPDLTKPIRARDEPGPPGGSAWHAGSPALPACALRLTPALAVIT